MKLPSTVTVGPYTYTLTADGDLLDELIGDPDKGGVLGLCDHPTQRIIVHPQLAPDALAETLLHEALHAIFYQCHPGLGADTEEHLVGVLAFPLLSFLRDNPATVRLLLRKATAHA